MEKKKLVCPICGKPTSNYYETYREDGLCREHKDLLKQGLIYQCPNCGKWNKKDVTCDCKKPKKEEKETTTQNKNDAKNNVIIINNENKSRCITCGTKTDGLLFCSNCYKKYKDKELLFKIKHCSEVELLDESYEGLFTCSDGHIVKSKSEREIDEYLFSKGIQHAYEPELPYGPKENEILRPDFLLKDYLGKDKDVYIEHWGYNENNISYTKTKKFKISIYKDLIKQQGLTLICTNEKFDAKNIKSALDRKLNKNFIKENEINFDD